MQDDADFRADPGKARGRKPNFPSTKPAESPHRVGCWEFARQCGLDWGAVGDGNGWPFVALWPTGLDQAKGEEHHPLATLDKNPGAGPFRSVPGDS